MALYPENAVLMAPLAGFTDLPYRHSARRYGCNYAFTEMVDAGSLVYQNDKTMRFLNRGEHEQWLGVQLIGADHQILKNAVEILNPMHFDVIDFNLGCPAPKVVKKGEGAALGRRIDDAVACFDIIKKHSSLPVTAKIRILDQDDPAPTLELVKKLENAGAEAVTIHGRLLSAYYSGPVYTDIIAAVNAATNIQIIANGGVVDYKTYCEIRSQSTCNLVMVARGAMGNPWLFRELEQGDDFIPPTVNELIEEMEAHVFEMIPYYGESLAMRVARKVILDYLRGRGFPGALKSKVSGLITEDDFRLFMDEVKVGPSNRYWQWLDTCPEAERRIRKNPES